MKILEAIDKIPLAALAIFALLMMLAPFVPEPHLLEKLGMLADGELTRPLDIIDLIMHSFLLVLLLIRLIRLKKKS